MTPDGTEAIAGELRRRGLAAPARLLIEAHRPLQPLLGDLATFLTPVLRPFLGVRTEAIRAALDTDDGIDGLIRQFEREDGG
jgi:hypothetical protein